MKITVYYEDHHDRAVIEVPDKDCEIWVETDYQQRLAAAEDKCAVTRRTPQQIMDEECNRPTYNSHHAGTRRHIPLDALDPMGDTLIGEDGIDIDRYEDLYAAIEQLTPEQRKLVHRVFWEGVKQIEIAREEGVAEHVISKRMARIYSSLKRSLSREKKHSGDR